MIPEKGTYLDAMKRILRDATTLDKELQKDLKRQYDIILINVANCQAKCNTFEK